MLQKNIYANETGKLHQSLVVRALFYSLSPSLWGSNSLQNTEIFCKKNVFKHFQDNFCFLDTLTVVRMKLFGAAQLQLATVIPYLKKIQKYINHVIGNQKFTLYWKTKNQNWIFMHNFCWFFWTFWSIKRLF